MTASELRLGNLILFRSNVICLDTNYELFKSLVDISRNDKRYKPIQLTEEWLLKFGFVQKNIANKLSESWYELKYLSNEHDKIITSWVSILLNIETWSCVICDEHPEEIGANTKAKIEYVHKLQNFCFALTGEELTFE